MMLAPAITSAQAPAPPAGAKTVLSRPLAEAMTKKARELFAEGVQAAGLGRLADARAAFLAAQGLSPHYSNLCNLGDVELRLGMHIEAATRLRACAEGIQSDAKATAAERDGATKLFEKAKANVVEVVVLAPPEGTEPARIAVSLDGGALGSAPPAVVVYAAPGKHVIELTADDHEAQRVELEAEGGARKEVQPALRKKAAPEPTVTATATSVAPPPPRSMVPAFVLGGVGLASAIAGGVLVGSSVAMGSDMLSAVPVTGDGKPACRRTLEPTASASAACDAWRARGAEASTVGNVGVGLFVVAGLAAVGAAGYALWPTITGQSSAATWRLSPIVTAQEGGVRIEGGF